MSSLRPFWRYFGAKWRSYETAPDIEATWFIDPPYQKMGRHYVHSLSVDQYGSLATWCQSRQGQVIVCEGARVPRARRLK